MRARNGIGLAVAMSALASLGGCGGGGGGSSGSATGSGTTAVAVDPQTLGSVPQQAGVSLDVTPCLLQEVVPGRGVGSLVLPDVLTVDPSKPAGFPNGRKLDDPVVDLTLAALFLDLKKYPVDYFAKLPLDPSGNDVPLRAAFPYFAPAQGNPPLGSTAGTNFNFRADPSSAYVRVDRMGMPAVATVLISSSHKNEYNDASPADDSGLKFYSDIQATLTNLANALSDDFAQRGLTQCAIPKK